MLLHMYGEAMTRIKMIGLLIKLPQLAKGMSKNAVCRYTLLKTKQKRFSDESGMVYVRQVCDSTI